MPRLCAANGSVRAIQALPPGVPIEQGQSQTRALDAFIPKFYGEAPPFRATERTLLDQRRGGPFSGAWHRQASIARSRRITCEALRVTLFLLGTVDYPGPDGPYSTISLWNRVVCSLKSAKKRDPQRFWQFPGAFHFA
jgi:hypothetical protein